LDSCGGLHKAELKIAAPELEHRCAEQAARWTAERSALLSETAARLLATADPQGVVDDLFRKVMGFLDCDAFLNYLLDEKSGRLQLNACAGVPQETVNRIQWLDRCVSICGRVVCESRPITAEFLQSCDAPEAALVKSLGLEAYCCHPLMAQGRVAGTLSFGTRSRQSFSPAEVEVMGAVANLVSMAIGRILGEKALRAAEARFRGIYEHALAGIAIADREGNLVQCNPAFCALVGYTQDELIGALFSSLIHPEDRARDVGLWRGLLAKEACSFEVEGRYVKKNGQPVWVRKTVSSLPDEDGAPAFFLALAVNITERKQAEEALREGEAKLARDAAALQRLNEASSRLWRAQTLQEGLDEMLGAAIELLGADRGNIRLFDPSRRVLRLVAQRGFDPAFLSPFGEATIDAHTAFAASLFLGERVVIDDVEADERCAPYRHLVSKAGIRAFQSTSLVARDGIPIGVLSTHFRNPHRPSEQDLQRLDLYARQAADFIERCRAEERLRESEARYRMLHESLRDAYVQCSMDGRIVECNEIYCRMLGYSYEEIRALTYQELTPERWYEFEEGIVQEQILLRGYSDVYEKEYRRKDGSIIPVELRTILSREAGQPKAMWAIVRDISDRKRAEAALKASEKRFRATFENAAVGVAHASPDGKWLLVNRRLCEILGYTAEELLKKTIQDVTHPADFEADLAQIRSVIADEIDSFGMEKRFLRKDGSVVWTRITTACVRNADRSVDYAIGIIEDISDQKRIEEVQRRQARLLDLSREAIFSWNLGGAIESWNEGAAALYGYSREEAVGRISHELLATWHPEGMAAIVSQLEKNGQWCGELIHRAKDGCFVIVESSHQVLREGQDKLVLETNRDITDRKAAEEQLRQSEERYRGIFEKAGTGIAITDLDGRFQSCNPAYSAMLGYTEEELRALNFSDLIHPDDRDANMIEIRRLVSEDIPSFEVFNRYLGKSGKPLWAHKHVSLLRDSAGRPANIVALVTDMTERKQYENQIKMLLREVNHRAKNMLALVQAIARQTAAANPDDFVERFGERVRSLATSQDLLVKHEWKGVDLGELVRLQLAHFKDSMGSRIEVRGPSLLISSSAAQTIGMALHELSTNAGKYGALSGGEGRIEVDWRLESPNGGEAQFLMCWRELCGPPVAAPKRSGFGSTVIGPMAKIGLNAEIELIYGEGGLNWRLACPAVNVLERSAALPDPRV
jgi:PAS domain S-box-containing protein